MKKASVVLLAAVLVAAFAGLAAAAPASVNWTGFYLGANAGYGWGNGDIKISGEYEDESFSEKIKIAPDGIIGGFQAGYNSRTDSFIIGVETDFQFSDMNGSKTVSFEPDPYSYVEGRVSQSTDWFGTLRLRAGVLANPSTLLYATGGFAYGRVKYGVSGSYYYDGYFSPVSATEGNDNGYSISVSDGKTKTGWTVGGGIEHAFDKNWSIKAEYLYYKLGSRVFSDSDLYSDSEIQSADSSADYIQAKWGASAGIARIGFNYRF